MQLLKITLFTIALLSTQAFADSGMDTMDTTSDPMDPQPGRLERFRQKLKSRTGSIFGSRSGSTSPAEETAGLNGMHTIGAPNPYVNSGQTSEDELSRILREEFPDGSPSDEGASPIARDASDLSDFERPGSRRRRLAGYALRQAGKFATVVLDDMQLWDELQALVEIALVAADKLSGSPWVGSPESQAYVQKLKQSKKLQIIRKVIAEGIARQNKKTQ